MYYEKNGLGTRLVNTYATKSSRLPPLHNIIDITRLEWIGNALNNRSIILVTATWLYNYLHNVRLYPQVVARLLGRLLHELEMNYFEIP